MKTYYIQFKTSINQGVYFSKQVEAVNAKDAVKEIMAEAQIPARFVVKVEDVKV